MTTQAFVSAGWNGRDWRDPHLNYAEALAHGLTLQPRGADPGERGGYWRPGRLYASDSAAGALVRTPATALAAAEGAWPGRLFRLRGRRLDRQHDSLALTDVHVVEEFPLTAGWGPRAPTVAAFLSTVTSLSPAAWHDLASRCDDADQDELDQLEAAIAASRRRREVGAAQLAVRVAAAAPARHVRGAGNRSAALRGTLLLEQMAAALVVSDRLPVDVSERLLHPLSILDLTTAEVSLPASP